MRACKAWLSHVHRLSHVRLNPLRLDHFRLDIETFALDRLAACSPSWLILDLSTPSRPTIARFSPVRKVGDASFLSPKPGFGTHPTPASPLSTPPPCSHLISRFHARRAPLRVARRGTMHSLRRPCSPRPDRLNSRRLNHVRLTRCFWDPESLSFDRFAAYLSRHSEDLSAVASSPPVA